MVEWIGWEVKRRFLLVVVLVLDDYNVVSLLWNVNLIVNKKMLVDSRWFKVYKFMNEWMYNCKNWFYGNKNDIYRFNLIWFNLFLRMVCIN